MTGPHDDPWQLPTGSPPASGAAAPAAPGWRPDPWAMPDGPPGKVRPTGRSILLFLVTIGIYSYVYNYKVHKEMKEHSGRGVGGGVALLLTFVASIAMPFVTSAEVGALYARRGQPEPVRGWSGLWVLLPVLGGYVVMLGIIMSLAATTDAGSTASDGELLAIIAGSVGFAAVAIAGAVVWFVKTNGALNRYWESVSSR